MTPRGTPRRLDDATVARLRAEHGITVVKDRPRSEYGRPLGPTEITEQRIRAARRALTRWGFDPNAPTLPRGVGVRLRQAMNLTVPEYNYLRTQMVRAGSHR
ncbi:hypothetical protein ACXYTP_07285 [Tsukamurella ocularis]|uniref:hypothetical protein n=1 Tax=Tsukamurella ocularis TaxID=1970234 RepID=UPI0039F0ABA3